MQINSVRSSIAKNVLTILKPIADMTSQLSLMTNSLINSIAGISKAISDAIPTDYMQGFASALRDIYDNPHSILNYANYEQKLNNFHWAWPYEFKANEIKMVIESIDSERDFDKYLLVYFSKERVNQMNDCIAAKLPSGHRAFFQQIRHAYENKDYAIANNAIMSILDNLLSVYLSNRGNVHRCGMFKPITEILSDSFWTCDSLMAFRIIMLSHNIDFIFQNYNFGDRIIIETNKKVRRHPSVHGFMYSNKRIDTLMLLNTLNELLIQQENLEPFRNSLVLNKKNKKEFEIIESQKKKVYCPMVKIFILDYIRENRDGLTQKQIFEYIKPAFPNDGFMTPKYISYLLQSMRKHDSVIYCVKRNSSYLWYSQID